MKKLVIIFVLLLLVVSLTSCSDPLPSGHATEILCYGEHYNYHNVDFEYINETTVKIKGAIQDTYIPTTSIIRIRVDK